MGEPDTEEVKDFLAGVIGRDSDCFLTRLFKSSDGVLLGVLGPPDLFFCRLADGSEIGLIFSGSVDCIAA